MTDAKDYGEPWAASYGYVDDRHNDTIARDATTDDAARIVACVNACQGMADPAAEIARLRQLVHDVYSPLYDARTMIELALIGELNMTPDRVKQLQERSAQCESLLGRLIERDKE